MKTLLSILMMLIVTVSAVAQPPEKISYQAVVRDAANKLVTNQAVGLKVSILQTSATGTVVYAETQTPTTNANGLISISIGTGTVVSGTFSTIDWSAGPYYIKTEIAPAGGTAYSITAVSELLSVPYALHAKTVQTGDNWGTQTAATDATLSGNGLTATPHKIAQQSATNGQVLKWNGTTWLPANDESGGFSLPWSGTANNTTQALKISNTGSGTAIFGESTSGSGVFGMTDGINTSGVFGLAHALTGKSYGVRGESDSPDAFSGYFVGSKFYISGNTGIGTENPSAKLDVAGQVKITGGNPGAGKVLTSDATGLASWQIQAINPFISSGGITRSAFLTDHFIFGASTLDNVTGDEDNMRFSFNKVKGAFRAGTVTSDRWNDANVGIGSVAMGMDTRALGNYSTALGNSTISNGNYSTSTGFATQATGISSFSSGDHTIVSGKNSVALGDFTTASGDNSFSMGNNTSAVGSRSVAFGNYTVANSAVCFVIGHNNVGNGDPQSWHLTDPVFEIGIGYSPERKNAMTVLRNGNVGIGPSMPVAKLDIDGQIKIAGGNPGIGKVLTSDNNGLATWQTLPSGSWQTSGSNIYFNTGNTGIGTATPAAKLDVSASQGPNIIIRDSDGGPGRPGIQFINNDIHFIGADDTSTEIFGFYSKYGDIRTNAARLNIHGPANDNWGRYIGLTHNGTNGVIDTDTGYLLLSPGSGRVGIGTATPMGVFDVAGGSTIFRPNSSDNTKMLVHDYTGTAMRIYTDYLTGTAYDLILGTYPNGHANQLFLKQSNGFVGIRNSSPEQALDVNGNARFRSIGSGAYSGVVNRTADGTLTTATSDIRLKENINTLQSGLEKVMQLRGVSFTWKNNPEYGTRIGFVAQEFEKIIPELVFTNENDGYKGINYAEVTAVLVEAIKELKAENDKLKNENDIIKTENNQLKMISENNETRLTEVENLLRDLIKEIKNTNL